MDSQDNTQGQAQSGQQGSTQNAQADLGQVANRAKAATAGFSIEKLFQGRIDNTNYFYLAISSIVAGTILSMIPVIGGIISLAIGVVGVGATIRRWHDLGQTGWLTLLCLLGPIGLLVVIYLCWKHGTGTANAYGEAPDPKREFFKAVLNT
jgi:hypothetical protein